MRPLLRADRTNDPFVITNFLAVITFAIALAFRAERVL
jgi:hypothetical protein